MTLSLLLYFHFNAFIWFNFLFAFFLSFSFVLLSFYYAYLPTFSFTCAITLNLCLLCLLFEMSSVYVLFFVE